MFYACAMTTNPYTYQASTMSLCHLVRGPIPRAIKYPQSPLEEVCLYTVLGFPANNGRDRTLTL